MLVLSVGFVFYFFVFILLFVFLMGGDVYCGSFVVGIEFIYWLVDGKCKLGVVE